MLGYYPEPPTTERPRPIYKPIYTYPKPTSTMHHHTALPVRPSWDHETNHISSPSYHPLVHPDEHFDLMDDNNNGYGETDAPSFNHHTYDEFNNNNNNNPGHHHGNTYNEADNDEDYRPYQGTN